ncbi:hypothetical protein HQQ80_00330 [Microbacteriaceae bacterium VKM Ac-2855]|nr:hypothetical protein [Microbacteriaceae bacterium VKM Ac-2855]
MTWSVVVVLAVLLVALLQVFLWQRRRRIRRELLTYGTRTAGRVVSIATGARGDAAATRDAGLLIVTYRTADGVDRRAVKVPHRRGDAWMAGEPVAVLYDERRPADSERVLLGFGRTSKTWFTARLQPGL